MPLLPIQEVKPGCYLGNTIYTENGLPLLQKGVKLTASYIRRLEKKGYKSLFVLSEDEKDIELKDVVSPVLRQNTQRMLFNTFEKLKDSEQPRRFANNFNQLNGMVDKIVDELRYQQSLVADLVNLKCVSSYTLEHSVNVGILGAILGIKSGLNRREVRNLLRAGLFHDIGKLFVPEEILHKPAALTDEEYQQMKAHPEKGFQLLHYQLDVDPIISVGSKTHHERWDGSGYPLGTAGKETHAFGRILAAVDVYDAMTSDRVYRKALPPHEVLEYINDLSGTQFDPEVVDLFNKSVYPYPTGMHITLNTGEKAIVIENNPKRISRPTVRLLSGKDGRREIYDLSANPDITIVSESAEHIRPMGA